MTTYVAARSNHFRVRDEGAFLRWVETLPGVDAYRGTPRDHPDDPEDHPNPSYALLADAGWPSWREVALYHFDEMAYLDFGERRIEDLRATGVPEERLKLARAAMHEEYLRRAYGAAEERELDWARELSPHLAEGEVAVLQEVGADKLKYLFGGAIAVNHRGEELRPDIDDIYRVVMDAGWAENVTEAAY